MDIPSDSLVSYVLPASLTEESEGFSVGNRVVVHDGKPEVKGRSGTIVFISQGQAHIAEHGSAEQVSSHCKLSHSSAQSFQFRVPFHWLKLETENVDKLQKSLPLTSSVAKGKSPHH